MTSTSRESRPSRRASCDMKCGFRARWKSSWASATGKPVSRLTIPKVLRAPARHYPPRYKPTRAAPVQGGQRPDASRPPPRAGAKKLAGTGAGAAKRRSWLPPSSNRSEERSMESGSMAAGEAGPATERPGDWGAGEKGLKANAIGYASNIVIGVASTAPGYSLAATLGFIVAVPGVGLQAPAVLLVSFAPMLCIAFGYRYMNRADPDCGTTFAWVTRGMGPHLGW